MVDRRGEQPLGYSNGWAFLGNALTSPRLAFERAQNVSYWWPACGVTAVYVLLGGVLVGHLAFIVLGIGVVGCLGFLATA